MSFNDIKPSDVFVTQSKLVPEFHSGKSVPNVNCVGIISYCIILVFFFYCRNLNSNRFRFLHNNTFSNLYQLTTLYLSSNAIQSVPLDAFSNTTSLVNL